MVYSFFSFLFSFVSLVAVPSAFADLGDESSASVEVPRSTAVANGIYVLRRPLTLVPNQWQALDETRENADGTSIHLKKNEMIALENAGRGRLRVTIRVPGDQIGETPDSFLLSGAELPLSEIEKFSDGDGVDLYAAEEQEPIEVAGACKRLVERHLHFKVSGLCATNVSDYALRRVGFYRTNCERAQLALWAGGHAVRGSRGRKCGHMAYRSGRSWSSGDYHGDPGRRYHSQRCFARGHGSTWSV